MNNSLSSWFVIQIFVTSQRVKENTTDIIQTRRRLVEGIFNAKAAKLLATKTAGRVCFTMEELVTTQRK